MNLTELARRARTTAASRPMLPGDHGLSPLSGGMTHDVFVPAESPHLVLKVFRTLGGGEAEHEWDALVGLADLGIAPAPVHFDRANPPVVIMERAPGVAFEAKVLRAEHAAAIGRAHRLVHRVEPERRRVRPHSGLHAARTELLRSDSAPDPGWSTVAVEAWRAAGAFMSPVEVDRLASVDDLRFSRGDPNLSNYLWSEERLVLVDWENSDYNDPALELADMAEHASTRVLSDDFFAAVADATELTLADRARVARGRRMMACFWLVLIADRMRCGLPVTVSLDEQAARTLATLAA